MTELELAIEHMRMTLLSASALDAPHATVTVAELALLLADYDKLKQAEPQVCAQCYLETATGQREGEPAYAFLTAGGNTACRDHLLIQQQPIGPGRTPGGLHLPGANGRLQ
jgi:hypothetical protein